MSMSIVLRELGPGPIEVLTRVKDFNIQSMDNEQGQAVVVPADTLVAFRATSFRELKDPADPEGTTNMWEFRTTQPLEGGAVAHHKVFLRAEDLFMIRSVSQVAL